jgi:chromosome partitioning protein
MTKIIGLVQVKGGAGRSTVSTNLAGELSKVGKTVLIDCDMPQGTSASWYAVRQQKGRQGNLQADTATDHTELIKKVKLHKDADYIILDGAPRIAEMTKAILILADLCLVPVGASNAEIWATSDILDIISQANQVKQVEARMLWTRYRAHTRLAQELSGLASEELGLQALTASTGMRVAYMQALGEGLTVTELADASARDEINAIVSEVLNLIKG